MRETVVAWPVVVWLGLLGSVAGGGEAKQGPWAVLENDAVRLSFDTAGRVTEFSDKRTGTSFVQPHDGLLPVLWIDAWSNNMAMQVVDPVLEESGGFSQADPGLLYSTAKSGDLIRLTLEEGRNNADTDGDRNSLTWTHRFPGGLDSRVSIRLEADGTTRWQVHVKNTADVKPAEQVRGFRVAFPVLSGLCVDGRPEENVLARTFVQGELIPNPSQHAFQRPGQPGGFTNVLTYPGWASMPWMDLYRRPADGAETAGLFFASYDPTFNQVDIEAVPDPRRKTLTLGMRSLAYLEPGEEWRSQTFILAPHAGDWHWAADRYRADSAAWFVKRDVPEWVRGVHGWFGAGGPSYRFADLPAMLEDARWLGINYLQCWSEMLENVGPEKKRKAYYCFLLPDPDRGGEAEMEAGVRRVRDMGGHVGFYSNFWTWDADSGACLQQWKDQIPPGVKIPWWHEFRRYMSVFPDGHMKAGDFTSGYAGTCPGAEGWRDYLRFWVVDKYVGQYGVDAWYFDSFPVTMFAAARVCFSPHHAHRPHGVGPSLVEFSRMIRQKSAPHGKLAVASESVGDAFMQYHSHALGLELISGLTEYQSPEIYTYTFPDHLIFSGSCNGCGSGLEYYYADYRGREVDGRTRRFDALDRVFLMGYRFDVLGHKLRREDPVMERIRQLIAIRERIKDDWYASSFRDEIGLGPRPTDVHAKVFRHDQGRSLTIALIDRREDKAAFTLRVTPAALDVVGLSAATLHTLDGGETPIDLRPGPDGGIDLAVPGRTNNAAAVVLRRP